MTGHVCAAIPLRWVVYGADYCGASAVITYYLSRCPLLNNMSDGLSRPLFIRECKGFLHFGHMHPKPARMLNFFTFLY